MGKVKTEVQELIDTCRRKYEEGGVVEVIGYIEEAIRQGQDMIMLDVQYKHCTACDANMPSIYGTCLICGQQILPEDHPEFLKKIDFTTLRGQKGVLIKLADVIRDTKPQPNSDMVVILVPKDTEDVLEGILGLIDAVQDYAVEEMGIPEMHVYDFDLEEQREGSTPVFESTGIKDSRGNVLNVGDKTIIRQLCAGCNSDNLDLTRTYANKLEDGKEVIQVWCNDCQDFHPAYEAIFKSKKYKVEGFQVVNDDDIHPMMEGSFCLYNLSQAREMLADRPGKNLFNEWRLLTCWTGDVEEPTKMFKGNPRK
jgi:hypothetical protein